MSKRVLSIRISDADLANCLDILSHYDIELSKSLSSNLVSVVRMFIKTHPQQCSDRSEAQAFEYLQQILSGVVPGSVVQKKRIDVNVPVNMDRGSMVRSAMNILTMSDMAVPPTIVSEVVVPEDRPVVDMSTFHFQPIDLTKEDPEQLELAVELHPQDPYDELSELESLIDLQMEELEIEREVKLLEKLKLSNVAVDPSRYEVRPTARVQQEVQSLKEDDLRLATDKLYQQSNEVEQSLLRIVYHNLPRSEWSSELATRLMTQLASQIKGA